jgi:hypothetical protein
MVADFEAFEVDFMFNGAENGRFLRSGAKELAEVAV